MLAEITILPIGRTHMGSPIEHIVDLVSRSGLSYQVTAMGTLVEGEDDTVWALLRRAHELAHKECGRVVTEIRLDEVLPGALGRPMPRVGDLLPATTDAAAELGHA